MIVALSKSDPGVVHLEQVVHEDVVEDAPSPVARPGDAWRGDGAGRPRAISKRATFDPAPPSDGGTG